MAGIAGVAAPKRKRLVQEMLKALSHRGQKGKKILDSGEYTIGINWNSIEEASVKFLLNQQVFSDGGDNIRKAEASVLNGVISLKRDEVGVAPLYYGYDRDGVLCFASEVKALSIATNDIRELLPGHEFSNGNLKRYYNLGLPVPVHQDHEKFASELKSLLERIIKNSIEADIVGSWLSGGIDSSTISYLARKNVRKLHTFAAGLSGAPDLHYARIVANRIKSDHHEIIVTIDTILQNLPEVIYYLESFDALLVRSSIINYIAGREASKYVSEIFSGEAGDELLAGYDYIKHLEEHQIEHELIDITGRLHNTALQRVDRCASAHGMMAHVPFADPEFIDFALSVPVACKLKNGIEKWILRKSMEGLLPQEVLYRPKAKFWEGGGIGRIMEDYASERISDRDFRKESVLPNGWILASKEELMYYRYFKESFGTVKNICWMGRTKTLN